MARPSRPVTLCSFSSMPGYISANCWTNSRQQVERGRFAGRDVEPAGFDAAALGGERVVQGVDLVDQRRRQFVERFAVGREADLRPAALEELVFSSRSSAWICSDTLGWLRNSFSAAFEMLPACAA